MAKHRADIEAQIAALQQELDQADTDDEVWIKDGDREIKVTGRRASSVLARFSDLWEEKTEDQADGGDDQDEDQDDDADTPPDKKPAAGGYFGKRATK